MNQLEQLKKIHHRRRDTGDFQSIKALRRGTQRPILP